MLFRVGMIFVVGMIGVVIMIVVVGVVGMIFVVVMVVVVVTIGVVGVVVMIFVTLLGFQRRAGLCHATGGGLGENEQVKGPGKCGHRSIDGGPVLGAFCGIFEPDKIGPGRAKLHRDRGPVHSDIERAHAMLVSIKCARFLGESWCSQQGDKKWKCLFHIDVSNLKTARPRRCHIDREAR